MVKIMMFALLRDKTGTSEVELDFEGTIAELKDQLKRRFPQASDIIDTVKFAVNEEYVDENYRVKSGDRVALIPPVSGG